MIRLINNELIKMFHKKSIFILWIVMFLFCLLNNILYKLDYDEEGNYKYDLSNKKEEKEKLEEELSKIDKNKKEDLSLYATIQTKLDIYSLKEEFSINSWQYLKIDDYLYDCIYNINLYSYLEDEELKEKSRLEYQEKYDNLMKDNWKYFLLIKLNDLKTEVSSLKDELSLTEDSLVKNDINSNIDNLEYEIKVINYRINNNIKEDNGYLNRALESYLTARSVIEDYKNKSTYQEKELYYEALADKKISEYILKTGKNINKENTLNYQMRTIVDDYEIFFVILILMVTSITVCEEFQTGTIKMLLIKPYSRCKILLSKYFTSLLILIISILFLIIVQFLIGIIIFDASSLSTRVVVYNCSTNMLREYSVFVYMIIRILMKMPTFIILSLICLLIGVLSANNLVSLSITLLLYLFKSTLENLSIQYNLKFMKYFICMNWNFEDYLLNGRFKYPFINFKQSSITWVIYFILMIFLSIKIFRKKDIKNI